jgi:peptidylprolyl isomerase
MGATVRDLDPATFRPVSPQQKSKRKPPPKLGESRTKPWVRITVVAIVVALALGSVVALLLNDNSNDSSNVSTDNTVGTSTSSAPGAGSAAGKPCVAAQGPLPAGAPDVPVTVGPPPSELVSKDLVVGTGATAESSSTITVDYIGVSCSTGKVFDASYGKQPATFPLSGVITGWQKGIPGMKVGGTRLLGIPPADGYGAQGSPPDIAPDETLWFVVQLKDVKAA